MSAQECMSGDQFMMHINDVGRAMSGDHEGRTMGDVARDDYARWSMDQNSDRYAGTDRFEDLSSSVATNGVQKPLELGTATDRYGHAIGLPVLRQGHHRFYAAFDEGVTHVPVTISPAGANALRAARFKGNIRGEE